MLQSSRTFPGSIRSAEFDRHERFNIAICSPAYNWDKALEKSETEAACGDIELGQNTSTTGGHMSSTPSGGNQLIPHGSGKIRRQQVATYGEDAPELWNPHTGEISKPEHTHEKRARSTSQK